MITNMNNPILYTGAEGHDFVIIGNLTPTIQMSVTLFPNRTKDELILTLDGMRYKGYWGSRLVEFYLTEDNGSYLMTLTDESWKDWKGSYWPSMDGGHGYKITL